MELKTVWWFSSHASSPPFVISDIGKMHQKLSGGHIVLGIMNKSLMIAKQTETNISQNAFVLFWVEDIEDSLYVLWMPPTKHHVLQCYHNLPFTNMTLLSSNVLVFITLKSIPSIIYLRKTIKMSTQVQMSILIIFVKIPVARFIALKYILNTMISFKKLPLFLL